MMNALYQLCVIAAFSGPLAAVEAGAGDPPAKPIVFRLTRRGEGDAGEISQVSSRDGKVVLKVGGKKYKGTVRLFDKATGEAIGPEILLAEPGSSYRVTALAIGPDNKTVATAKGNFSNDYGGVDVWDGTTGKKAAVDRGERYPGEVFSLTFSPDGKSLEITCGPPGGK